MPRQEPGTRLWSLKSLVPKRGFSDEIMPYASARPPVRKKTRPESTKRNRGVFQTLLVFVVSVLVINALFGEKGLIDGMKVRRQYRELASAIAELKRENAAFRDEARRLRADPRAIERLAREELGLISPGELLFIVKDEVKDERRPSRRAR